MVSGFVATLIALERAVVARRPVAVVIPAASAVGAVASLAGAATPLPALLMIMSGLGLAALLASGAPTLPGLGVAVMTAGALCWVAGGVAWTLADSVFVAVPWWIAFVVLVIAAERLELSRALRPSGVALAAFVVAVAVLAAGLAAAVPYPRLGLHVVGAGCAGLALWLLARDVPARGARVTGLVGFIRIATVSAYAWLLVGGGLLVAYGSDVAGPHRDGALHAIFVGFVFSMIFAHGPIVLPAVLGTAFRYRRWIYTPLVLLHVSLALRLAGDLLASPDARMWGGLLNGVAVLAFLANTAASVRPRCAPSVARPI